jgi:hypothetical protein
MRGMLSGTLFSAAAAMGLVLAAPPSPAAAAEVTYAACVVDRKPTSALMQLTGDIALFELDLRPIPGTPFALDPGECVTVTGLDRGTEPGLRREFPRAGWLVEAHVIAADQSHLNRGSHSSNQDED